MEKEIIFSGFFISISEDKVDINGFKEILKEKIYYAQEPDRVNRFSLEFYENYLKIKSGAGSAKPWNPIVVDTETQEDIPNPRLPNQVEPKETFAIIDFRTSLLWLSNSKKKTVITDFLKDRFQTPQVIIKDVYDEKMFIDTIRILDGIQVSAVPDFFTKSDVLKEKLVDEIYGYEASEATISFKYHQRWINDLLRGKIQKILDNKNYLKGIVISGRDEKGLGMLFNSDGFSRKIKFKTRIDKNEMYQADDVFAKLIIRTENEGN